MNVIDIKNLCFGYDSLQPYILKDITFSIDKGEVVAIVGLSGCGKSTLCNCINGIIPHVHKGIYSGNVYINNKNILNMTIPEISTCIGAVFQDPDSQIFLPLVEDELAFGPENLCIEKSEIARRISKALKRVGMEEYRYYETNALSGGQKQLIAIASVLTLEPEILIFDEVMSQIDFEGKERVRKVIKDLANSGKTIIMIEHDVNNLDLVDRIYLLKNSKIQKYE